MLSQNCPTLLLTPGYSFYKLFKLQTQVSRLYFSNLSIGLKTIFDMFFLTIFSLTNTRGSFCEAGKKLLLKDDD